MALNLTDGRPVTLTEGKVGRAVEASIRPPVLGRPVEIDGRSLVDGGLHNAVPVGAARELGASTVISVNVGEFFLLPERLRPLSAEVSQGLRRRSRTSADITAQVAFMADLLSRGRAARAAADLEIKPNMRGISSMWPWHIERAIRRGAAAARQALPEIRRLIAARAA